MTIWNLLIGFAIAGGILTLITGYYFKAHKSWLMTFLQNFTGVWFIFSGAVKAVDPLGTSIKMQQYFTEFNSTFKDTAAKFIAPIFPFLSDYSIAFSLIMIILEIVIGFMLVLGYKSKLTSWLFLIIMVFFTVLTGYTHLTAYVPDGVNFFEFSKWGNYVVTNMKVTDCGCFGDFLKLLPTTSFYKDLGLMPIALFFIFRYNNFHQLFRKRVSGAILTVITLASVAFCYYNTYSNEPVIDFRPFKNGVNIREQKLAEEKAAGAVKITDWKLKNEKTGEIKLIPDAEYMKSFESLKKDGWAFLEQIKTEPTIPHSKISDFGINDKNGSDISEDLLNEKGYTFLVVSSKIKSQESKIKTIVADSIFRTDTIKMKIAGVDSFELKKVFERVGQREETLKSFRFEDSYLKMFEDKINPIMAQAEKAGHKIAAVVPFNDPKKIEEFRHVAQAAYPFYTADDILLKTMIRSNPGLFLLKDGKIIQKWHINKLPNFEKISSEYLK